MLTGGSLWRSGTKEVELEFPLGSISQTPYGTLEILVGKVVNLELTGDTQWSDSCGYCKEVMLECVLLCLDNKGLLNL